jgi:curved DNA-binding protein CbpA
MTADIRKHYDTLELEPGATLKEVKTAYRELAQMNHPDKHGHNPKLHARATAKMKALNAAYQSVIAHLETNSPPGDQASPRSPER